MPGKPTLAVIIPAYNEECCIEACLRALLAQASEIDEIIVVDNNCTDKTPEIVRRLQKTSSLIRLVNEPISGIIPARNRGLGVAKSDILGRIDADTVVMPGWAAAVRKYFAEHPDAQAASGPTFPHDAPFGRIVELVMTFFLVQSNKKAGGVGELFGSNMAIRRKAWNLVKDKLCNRTDFMEDLDIGVHLAQHDQQIAFIVPMKASTSARRALMGPLHYWEYQKMWPKTYEVHGMKGAAARIWVFAAIGLVMHALIWLPFRAWDPAKRRISLTYLFSDYKQRIMPQKTKD